MRFEHKPVLLDECIEGLQIKPDGIYVDGTLGGAGHSTEILKRLGENGLLIGIDQDANAIAAATKRLQNYGIQIETDCIEYFNTNTKDKVERQSTKEKEQLSTKEENLLSTKEKLPKFAVVKTNFENLKSVLERLGVPAVDGILLDIGVSSHQLDEAERGFSYMQDAPLDMRMNRDRDFSAMDVVNDYSESELYRVIRDYGEEKWASRIAKFIVEERRNGPITTTFQLVNIIKAAIPKGARKDGPHPAKRTFQAIRIEVNGELAVLERAIAEGAPLLKEGGRFCIITFHSLEDRIVKNHFQQLERPCTCPKEFPVCICGKVPVLKQVNRKPIEASEEELEENPRARSAKLRVAENIYKR